MKRLLLIALLTYCGASQANPLFKQWCETFTAQGLVSLAANRMFGNISTLPEAQYKKRSAWVNNAYKIAEDRFKSVTGKEFQEIDESKPNSWVAQCQLKDIIQ